MYIKTSTRYTCIYQPLYYIVSENVFKSEKKPKKNVFTDFKNGTKYQRKGFRAHCNRTVLFHIYIYIYQFFIYFAVSIPHTTIRAMFLF